MHSTRFCPKIDCPADHYNVQALGNEEWIIDERWHVAAALPCCVICGTDLSTAPTRELHAPVLKFLLAL